MKTLELLNNCVLERNFAALDPLMSKETKLSILLEPTRLTTSGDGSEVKPLLQKRSSARKLILGSGRTETGREAADRHSLRDKDGDVELELGPVQPLSNLNPWPIPEKSIGATGFEPAT